MDGSEIIPLKRDCEAAVVPSGMTVTLQEGEEAQITQALGGAYTVIVNGNMFRIAGKDADALGKEPEDEGISNLDPSGSPLSGQALENRIWESMKSCYDPEIPVNIVDLGLIYDCHISDLGEEKGKKVEVKMTLTAPGCGMGDHLRNDVSTRISAIPGIHEVLVDLVWEPQWNQGMMTEAARLQLGLL